MHVSVAGQVALVTGASRGIGRATALGLAEAGADVVVTARRRPDLDTLAEEITALGRRAHVIVSDASDPDAAAAVVDEAAAALGTPTILVNNAGGGGAYVDGGGEGLFGTSVRSMTDLFTLNVTSPFAMTRAAAARMKDGGGSIVNVTSRLAMTPNPAVGAYCATKAALQSLTESWAQELGEFGIRVNAIAPGGVETANMSRITADPTLLSRYVESVPLGVLGQPRDAAACAVFLASDAARWISGSTILVTGGRP